MVSKQLFAIHIMLWGFGIAILFIANMLTNIIGTGNIFRFVVSPILVIAGTCLSVYGIRKLVQSFNPQNPQSKPVN